MDSTFDGVDTGVCSLQLTSGLHVNGRVYWKQTSSIPSHMLAVCENIRLPSGLWQNVAIEMMHRLFLCKLNAASATTQDSPMSLHVLLGTPDRTFTTPFSV